MNQSLKSKKSKSTDTSKLLKLNKIEIVNGLGKNDKLIISKSLNESLNNLSSLNGFKHQNHLNQNINKTMTIIKDKYFNDNLNNNDNDLDNLNLTNKKQIKSTSFESNLTESNLTDDSINSNFYLNGYSHLNSHESNLDIECNDSEFNDDNNKQNQTEIDDLLDKRNLNDQKIVEVVRNFFYLIFLLIIYKFNFLNLNLDLEIIINNNY